MPSHAFRDVPPDQLTVLLSAQGKRHVTRSVGRAGVGREGVHEGGVGSSWEMCKCDYAAGLGSGCVDVIASNPESERKWSWVRSYMNGPVHANDEHREWKLEAYMLGLQLG